MFGHAGQPRGGAQVRRGNVVTVQVDQGRGGQQGQPAAHHQQAAVLSQRRFGVEQPSDVAEIAAHPDQEDGRRSTGVGRGQIIHGQLQPLNRAAADLTSFSLSDQIQGGDLVGDGAVVPGGGQLVPARRAVWGQSAQCPATPSIPVEPIAMNTVRIPYSAAVRSRGSSRRVGRMCSPPGSPKARRALPGRGRARRPHRLARVRRGRSRCRRGRWRRSLRWSSCLLVSVSEPGQGAAASVLVSATGLRGGRRGRVRAGRGSAGPARTRRPYGPWPRPRRPAGGTGGHRRGSRPRWAGSAR